MEKVVSGLKAAKQKTLEVSKRTIEVGKTASGELTQRVSKKNIQQFARRGKHAVITTLGRTKASKDAAFEIKHRSAHNSLMILSELYKEMNLFIKHASAISDRYEAMVDLIERFRVSCDGYIAAETTEGAQYEDEDEEDDLVMINAGSPPTPSDTDPATGGDEPPRRSKYTYNLEAERLKDEKAEELHQAVGEIKKASEEMKETLQGSCMNLLSNTMRSLESENSRVQSEVVKASVDFDLLREETRKLQAEVDKLSESLERSPTNDLALPPQLKEAATADYEEKSAKLTDLKEDLDEAQQQFRTVTYEGKKSLLFTLEQTSMASWSCFNILFHQMQRFFGDVSRLTEPAAKVLIELKSSQTVAKAIDKDRQKMMKKHFGSATSAPPYLSVAGTGSGSSAVGAGGGTVGRGEGPGFDDVFADFIDSRKESIPTEFEGGHHGGDGEGHHQAAGSPQSVASSGSPGGVHSATLPIPSPMSSNASPWGSPQSQSQSSPQQSSPPPARHNDPVPWPPKPTGKNDAYDFFDE